MGAASCDGDGERNAVVVGLQPVALVDHVARVDWAMLESVPGERGGSIRVTATELEDILAQVNKHVLPNGDFSSPIRTLAGGSVANTLRGLAGGLGVRCKMVGARGNDEQGKMFATSMRSFQVDLSCLRVKSGPTGQCVCLVDALGNRTMRPCLSDAVRLQASELTREDFKGIKWLVLNGYGFYGEELVESAAHLAKLEGALVSMDLASFEVVRNFRPRLLKLLQSRKVDLCLANEDEARELMGGEPESTPESALKFLSQYCNNAVVMLGSKGCIARSGDEVVRAKAVEGGSVVDTTGAGDLFASGFLYGMINGLSLDHCCKLGCCTGAAVVQDLGGEIKQQGKKWMLQKMASMGLPVFQA
ncbi:hypothetical protein SELMODRAFT_169827 [Selaginella moellendorffii]|uniref:Carbohydrate kinase PfkB domain-containing protein n=1 Tax=Selaginella moellendorffii TaxID=88036 RepID=D8RB85_SELML|nr:uncharacterized protein LOC9650294 [Selaginella moellendorffii]EFJ30447.1 hypothetical protein SELMODRAFT_169827 [Selaginella moellendorffii]|eukprot:XP_002968193.1 uncharacterized protein LOC9650294 [Selaginella moellendorffii]